MEAITIKIMGLIIASLVGMFITKIFSDKKVSSLHDKLDNFEKILIKIDSKLEDIDALKHDVDELFTRLRAIESEVAVIKSKIDK